MRLYFSTGSVGIELKYNAISSTLLASMNTGSSACLLQLASVLSVEHHQRLLWLKLPHGCAYNENPTFLNLPDPFSLDSSRSNACSQNAPGFSPSQRTHQFLLLLSLPLLQMAHGSLQNSLCAFPHHWWLVFIIK